MKKFLSTILLSVICLLSLAQEYLVNDTVYAMRQDTRTPVRVIRYFKFQDSYEVENIISGTRYCISSKMLEFEQDKEGKSVVIQTVPNAVVSNDKIKDAGKYLKLSSNQMLWSIAASTIGGLLIGVMYPSTEGSAERILCVTASSVCGITATCLMFSSIINIGKAGKCLSSDYY